VNLNLGLEELLPRAAAAGTTGRPASANFAGGTYKNLEAELPNGHSYREFDVYPRSCGASRDATSREAPF
jgi:hypothetical protein